MRGRRQRRKRRASRGSRPKSGCAWRKRGADRLAEEARKAELKARCEKKGLDFETEEAKYQQKLAEKQAKKQKK